MWHGFMGRAHAALAGWRAARGQGTVEYVGLILLVAVVLAGVVQASEGFSDKGIATTILNELKEAVGRVGEDEPR